MEGRALAAKSRYDLALFAAWHGEAFAREKRLKPLGKYMASGQPKRQQGASEMLAAMRELNARGAPMTIRKVERRR